MYGRIVVLCVMHANESRKRPTLANLHKWPQSSGRSLSLTHTQMHTQSMEQGDSNWEKLEEMMENAEVGRVDGDSEWTEGETISPVI